MPGFCDDSWNLHDITQNNSHHHQGNRIKIILHWI